MHTDNASYIYDKLKEAGGRLLMARMWWLNYITRKNRRVLQAIETV